MTSSSRTILIEPNRLFRQGLKHLLSGTGFDVGAEFNTVELALEAGATGAAPRSRAGLGDQWPAGQGRS